MILSARYVRRPRRVWHCDWCERRIVGPHIYLYGAADVGDTPYGMRLHPDAACCPNGDGNAKIAAALALAESEAPHA